MKKKFTIVESKEGMNWEKVTLIARGLHNYFSKHYTGVVFTVSSGDQNGCEITAEISEEEAVGITRTAKRLAKEYSKMLEPFLVVKE